MTTGAGTALPLTIQPRRCEPSAAMTVNGEACVGKCAVEATGCGKKIRRSCASQAAAGIPMAIAAMTMSHSIFGAPSRGEAYDADLRCHAFGRVNVWIPYVDSVRPMPECLTPDHGRRGLTRSQQFQ